MSEYLAAADAWITQRHMPIRVKALCKNVKGTRCIILNEELSYEAKIEAIKHELLHFEHEDLGSEDTVEDIEARVVTYALEGRTWD